MSRVLQGPFADKLPGPNTQAIADRLWRAAREAEDNFTASDCREHIQSLAEALECIDRMIEGASDGRP